MMELVQDYLNNKVLSLVKQILICEEERKSILLELQTFQNTANNSGSGGNLAEVCESLKTMLEDLTVTVLNSDKSETCDSQREMKRKCRFFNRGYCKYNDKCKYYHSPVICEEYLEHGICMEDRCIKRHPKHCRYWANTPEGCRYEKCHYLHLNSEKYTEDNEHESLDDTENCGECTIEYDSTLSLRTCGMTTHENCQNESGVYCDTCKLSQDNSDLRQSHRSQKETEEGYFVTKLSLIHI